VVRVGIIIAVEVGALQIDRFQLLVADLDSGGVMAVASQRGS
jgi:hypothetical protein